MDMVSIPRDSRVDIPSCTYEDGSTSRAQSARFNAAFSIGAVIPLVPYLITSGPAAFVGALVAAFVALFAVGAAVSIVTGKGMLFSGVRQVLIGAAAAAVTYAVGRMIGANVS